MPVNGGAHFIRQQKMYIRYSGRIGNYFEVISGQDKSLQVELDLRSHKNQSSKRIDIN